MRHLASLALVGAALSASGAQSATYGFTATISMETWNFEDTTGQGIGLVHAGDVIKGTFDYSPAAPDFRTADQATYLNAILNSKVEVYRSGSLVVTLKQGPAFFSNGNPVDQSQLSARDGDPRGLRDTINLQAGGVGGLDPADLTKVVTPISLSPSHPEIIIPGWVIQFREACTSGTVAGGNCVSNDPAFDYYDGSQSAVDLVKAFQHNSVHDFYLTFQYASPSGDFDGDFEQALGSLDSLAAVPEPTTWAMMIAGLAFAGAAARRRRRQPIQLA